MTQKLLSHQVSSLTNVNKQKNSTFHLIFFTEEIRKMFKTVRYSEKGTNERIKEEETFVFFMNYLEDCEKGY